MKVAFYTLGCKVNQNETGALQQMFTSAGHEIVPAHSFADVYIVNSCTVTAGGDAKSRQWLRRVRRQNPNAVTVLAGCFPQAFPQEALIPEADIVTGTVGRGKLLQNVEVFLRNRQQLVDIAPHQKNEEFEELPLVKMEDRTRAFVKVEDGCNRRCAYCIIPKARGPVRSRDEAAIINELESLASGGYAEVVFTGINLPSYGKDTNTDLAELIEKSAQIEGIRRIRLSSLDPDLITPEQIERFAKVDKLCHSFHLSLQSGCDATLRRMRRPYTSAQYAAAAAALRTAMPDASLTTDVIVGFPGETEEEFAQSLAFVLQMEFLKVHVFPYSARPGTPAATFENQVEKGVKTERAHILQTKADEVRHTWMQAQKGKTEQALLEKQDANGNFTAYTRNYIPLHVPSAQANQGDIIPVILGNVEHDRVIATPITTF